MPLKRKSLAYIRTHNYSSGVMKTFKQNNPTLSFSKVIHKKTPKAEFIDFTSACISC